MLKRSVDVDLKSLVIFLNSLLERICAFTQIHHRSGCDQGQRQIPHGRY